MKRILCILLLAVGVAPQAEAQIPVEKQTPKQRALREKCMKWRRRMFLVRTSNFSCDGVASFYARAVSKRVGDWDYRNSCYKYVGHVETARMNQEAMNKLEFGYQQLENKSDYCPMMRQYGRRILGESRELLLPPRPVPKFND